MSFSVGWDSEMPRRITCFTQETQHGFMFLLPPPAHIKQTLSSDCTAEHARGVTAAPFCVVSVQFQLAEGSDEGLSGTSPKAS